MHVKWEKQIPPKNTACQLLRIELAGRSRENFRLSHNPEFFVTILMFERSHKLARIFTKLIFRYKCPCF
jgi:hypothetical protein